MYDMFPPATEWRIRTFCMYVAQGDTDKADELYEDVPLSKVYDKYARLKGYYYKQSKRR